MGLGGLQHLTASALAEYTSRRTKALAAMAARPQHSDKDEQSGEAASTAQGLKDNRQVFAVSDLMPCSSCCLFHGSLIMGYAVYRIKSD